MRPHDTLTAVAAAHERLLASVATMTDADARGPSRLAGWTRAHVVTHLARNADSFVGVTEGAAAGEIRRQYPVAGMRDRDIAAGATRSAAELIADLAAACRRLDQAWAQLADDRWDAVAELTAGPQPMREVVFRRLREVEIHHVDLDLGYSASDWPEAYVAVELRRQLDALPGRAGGDRELLAWLVGRASLPDLAPW